MSVQKKIFITGKDGFIGRNILESLGEKYDFVAPSRSELNLLDSEKVLSFLEQERPDVIIHLANIGGNRREKKFPNEVSNNLKMFFNLVRGKKYFDRIIVSGSGAEYDKRRPLKQVSEKDFDQFVPEDDYGFSKYIMSKYAEQVDFITHLRIFGIYGKYEDQSVRFISNNICRTLLDMPISINQNAFFEFLFIDDFIKILDYFINNSGKEKIYNIGNGTKISLVDIGNKILERSGKDLQVVVKKEGLNKEYTCNIERLKKEIPDLSFTPIEEGINDLFLYYSKNIKNINKEDILFD